MHPPQYRPYCLILESGEKSAVLIHDKNKTILAQQKEVFYTQTEFIQCTGDELL